MSLQPASYSEALAKVNSRPQKARKPLSRGNGLGKGKRVSQVNLGAKKRVVRKGKKHKVPSRKYLIKKIDNLVFQIVCARDPACVECGAVDRPTTGHVFSRRSFSTRWDLRNVHRQCWGDNYKAAMTAAASYHAWYVRTFGAIAFEELYQDWQRGHKYTRLELQNLVSVYQNKLAEYIK